MDPKWDSYSGSNRKKTDLNCHIVVFLSRYSSNRKASLFLKGSIQKEDGVNLLRFSERVGRY
jgi:hypothetical protein